MPYKNERKPYWYCWVQGVVGMVLFLAYLGLCIRIPWIGVGTMAVIVSLIVGIVIHDNQ